MSNRPKIKHKPIKDSERIDWGKLKQAQADDERIVMAVADLLDSMAASPDSPLQPLPPEPPERG